MSVGCGRKLAGTPCASVHSSLLPCSAVSPESKLFPRLQLNLEKPLSSVNLEERVSSRLLIQKELVNSILSTANCPERDLGIPLQRSISAAQTVSSKATAPRMPKTMT